MSVAASLRQRLTRSGGSQRLRDPVAWTSAVQLAKTVIAAVVAWLLATQAFGLPQPFLAPWSALLVVHATVYRTFSRGLRQVSGAVVGVVLAWALGTYVGLTPWSVSILLVIGLVIGSLRWFREESTAVAATGLIVLTTGFATHDIVLLSRLFDTGIGIGVGLVVNMVVWAPLGDYSAARAIDAVDDEVGRLLQDIAAGLDEAVDQEQIEEWLRRTVALDEQIDESWRLLRHAHESSRLNPRRAAASVRATPVFESILGDNEQAVAETRSMVRTLGHSITDVVAWDEEFRVGWVGLLREAGDAICVPDSARVAAVRGNLTTLSHELGELDLSSTHWPEYGALIMNLRNVVTCMDRVAEQNPVVLPRYRRRQRLISGRRPDPSRAR